MRKSIILTFVLILLVSFVSCTQTVENSADEIRMNKWSMTTKYDKKVTLYFIEDQGVFQIISSDKYSCVKLKGLCVIDKDKIAIFNEADNENYIFRYKLKGNKLKLFYMNGKIVLLREDKENPSVE